MIDIGLAAPGLTNESTCRNRSGDQRQWVAIARAVALAIKRITTDEPTADPGVQVTRQAENIIRTHDDRGLPLMPISHSLRPVFDLVDRIAAFRRGGSSLDRAMSKRTATIK